MSDFLNRVHTRRRAIYRLDDAPCLHSTEDAQAFIQQVGFCLLFPNPRIELPNLWQLAAGRLSLWKDQLPLQKGAYYGRRFGRRAGFVAPETLPALYVLTPTAEFRGDRFELYRHDFISQEVMRVVGLVQSQGPISTRDLRRALGYAARARRYRFARLLVEAERMFLIVRCGIASTGDARYVYLWDSFARFWPHIVEQAALLDHEQAGIAVISRYLQTVVAATTRQIAITFSLNHDFVQYYARQLVEHGEVARVALKEGEFFYFPDSLVFSGDE